jgi:predicted dehydrogenase
MTQAVPVARRVGGDAPARRYRGVLIGAGGVARSAHLPGFVADPRVASRFEIVAAVDPSPTASAPPGIPLLRDRDELATIGPIDFVDICTPTGTHLALTLWALRAGYHVLCEKPVAVDRAQAAEIRTVAEQAGRIVMPCHQYRFNPAWQRMGDWLRAGLIGRWHLAELAVYRPAADAGVAGDAPWRIRQSESAGGILLDHGTHLLYSILDLAGPPDAVRGWTGRLRHHGYDVEDTAQVTLEYPERLASLFLTWAATTRENRVRFIGEAGVIDWQGGVLTLERNGGVETHDFSAQLDKRSYAGWFAALFGTFAEALDRGDAATPMADLTRVATVLEAAYTSARSGCRVPVGH